MIDSRYARIMHSIEAEWRAIPGFPGFEVCDHGHVRSSRGTLHISTSDSGYLRVRPTVNGKRKSLLCHKAVLLAFVGPPPSPEYHGAHKNGQLHDNRLDNLEWKLPVHNEADKRAHGTHPQCFSGYKPSPEQVERVRELVAAGVSYRAAAKELGIHRSSVSRIARGLRHGNT